MIHSVLGIPIGALCAIFVGIAQRFDTPTYILATLIGVTAGFFIGRGIDMWVDANRWRL